MSFLLAAVMVLSTLVILPITAFAGDPEITVYTVAGASDLMGSEWDQSDDANNMTDMGDGSFQLVKENVVLHAGDYDYKVVGNHEWGIGECPSYGNETLTIDEDGIYTITFTFVPDQADLMAIPDKTGNGPTPGGSGSVTAVELTAGELTREDLNTLPADLVTLKSITGCAEDEVEFLTAVYYFYDENKAFICAGQKSGTEIYWVDSEFEPLSGTPDFDKIKFVKACVYGRRDLELDDFASNVTVKVNGKDLAMIPASAECAEGYGCSGDMLDIAIVYDLSAHTHAGVKQNGQPATETAAGYNAYYKCDCGLYFEDENCTVEIGDESALTAWKAEGGAGYIAPNGGDKGGANLAWLWILLGLLLLLIVIYVVVFFIWKKKEELPDALAFLGFLVPSYKAINKALFKKKDGSNEQ